MPFANEMRPYTRENILTLKPNQNGVYGIFRDTVAIYVGSGDLRERLLAHMNGGVWNGVRILEEETVEEMHTIQPPGNIDMGEVYYGLAWTIMEDPMIFNVTLSGHGGGVYGVCTWMYYIPDENIGVIYFTNGDTLYENNIIINQISQLILKISFYQKAGFNLFSHIDFRNSGR